MNSIKWFNASYLFQNLKKSKAILALFLIIVPLLSAVSLIVSANHNANFISLDFNDISIFAIFGMYIIPVIVSISLFGYVFKRNSSDFVGSMPLNRSTIFVTNTIGGILLLAAMTFISTILILLVSYFLPTIIISKSMMLDYFFIWTITYIFVFTAANLAASVSGNMITQIAVTALLIFLVPFVAHSLSSFSNSHILELQCSEASCSPTSYNCYNDKECLANQDQGIYSQNVAYKTTYQYNIPYQYASIIYANSDISISPAQLGRMFLVSLLFFGLGVYFFRKKSMEVTESSFKNIHVHNIVKCLTIVPMIMYVAMSYNYNSADFAFFALILVFVYFFVFDLITKKSISHIRLSLVYFVLTTILVGGYSYALVKEGIKPTTTLNASDIKEISLVSSDSYADTSNIYIADQDLTNLIVKSLIATHDDGDILYTNNTITTSIKLKNNKIYQIVLDNLPQTEYNQILNQAYNNQKFSDTLKQVDYKHVYAISADNLVLDPANNQEVITMIQKGLSNTNIADYHKLAQGYNISLYTYDNHQMKVYNVNSAINKDLTRYISQYANDCIRHEIIDKNPDIDHIQNIYVSGSENVAFDSINDYLIGRAYSEIYVFIKDNINRTCDLTKDYININITYKNKQYDFYTNNIEGFNKVLDAKKQQIKDTPEYQEALKLYEDDNNG